MAPIWVLCSACSSSSSGPPSGVTCSGTSDGGGSGASLTAALASAKPGSCVLLGTSTYTGSFVVPAGVTLASRSGQRATLTGGMASAPVVQITGGTGSALADVDVTNAAGVGVAVRGGAASLTNVNVTGAMSAAFAALCQGSSCGTDIVTLDSVSLTKSALGAWISGAYVKMNGGACTDEAVNDLSGGIGVVAEAGGRVELVGVDIERNGGVGVLIDGGGGTTALIQDTTVSNNSDRGVWVQGLTGTLANPALSIQGATKIENNSIVGLGALDSHGIIFVGGFVDNTQLAPVVTNLGSTDKIGDGVGFFGGSGDVKLDTVSITANGRAAGLVDNNTGVIIFVGGKVEAGASNLLVVVQNTTDTKDVQVPAAEITAHTMPLSISAPTIPLSTVLQ
jgi:parallel beta helix pectate lyase-like protein